MILEVFHPMMTSMEKNRTLSKCREGTLPEQFESTFPKIAEVVSSMLKKNPDERPSIEDMKYFLPLFTNKMKVEMKIGRKTRAKAYYVSVDEETLFIYCEKNLTKAKYIYKLNETTFTVSENSDSSDASFKLEAQHGILHNFEITGSKTHESVVLLTKIKSLQNN